MKKIKHCFAILTTIMLCQCTTVSYLPVPGQLGLSTRGAHISVYRHKKPRLQGELIAVDSSQLFVLVYKTRACTPIPIQDINRFNLQFAENKRYQWTIPVFTLASFAHGFGVVVSGPVNLLVTTIVTASGESVFQVDNKDMTYEQIKMFARFPQGMPPRLRLADVQ